MVGTSVVVTVESLVSCDMVVDGSSEEDSLGSLEVEISSKAVVSGLNVDTEPLVEVTTSLVS